MIQVTVPTVGESIKEVQIATWLKKEGEWIAKDENLVELETEKASVQVPAPVSGVVRKLCKRQEDFANVGELIAEIEPADNPARATSANQTSPAGGPSIVAGSPAAEPRIMPAARSLMEEKGIRADQVTATGPGGRILKEDILRTAATSQEQPTASAKAAVTSSPAPALATGSLESTAREISVAGHDRPERMEEVKPLSMIRRTIAARLVQAQHTAALLTTFNEVDMQPVMELRQKYRDAFEQRHRVKLGFMSFFAKASVEALRRFPSVNAEVRGNNIVYRHYADIGIAIGGGKGLVVPVLRNVEKMSFAEVERTIGDFARKAMENWLMPEDFEGGTFTISNGGIYGSLLSTPIVNPPQSAILGLHAIQERPVARDGHVVIRSMMYLALTYDHRIIDGREAVSFLKTVKEIIEDPARLFLEI